MIIGARYSESLKGWFYTVDFEDGNSAESMHYWPSKTQAIEQAKRIYKKTQILPCPFTPEESLIRLDDICSYYNGKEHDVKNISDALKVRTPAIADGVDPDMPAQQLRLHFGELTDDELRLVRAAIRFANSGKAATDEG